MHLFALSLLIALVPVPQVSDLTTFPGRYETERVIERGDRFRAVLEIERERERIDPRFWDEYLAHWRKQQNAWESLLEAYKSIEDKSDEQSQGVAMYHLREVRDKIGVENYRLRRMPSNMPYAPRLWAPWLR